MLMILFPQLDVTNNKVVLAKSLSFDIIGKRSFI